MRRVKACGVEPYDKHFGDGYQVGHEGFSPYERANRLREAFLDTEFYIDAQRACLVTEAYQQNPDQPQVIKTAKALDHVLRNVDIQIYDDELIAGEIAAPMKAAPVYPEFAYNWIMDEMENAPFEKREFDQYMITEETKEKLRGIAGFWKGNTVEESINAQLSFDEQKGSEMGVGMYLLNLYHYGGIGHLVANYEKLLAIGYSGYRKLVEDKLATLDNSLPGSADKRNLYKAMLITIDASTCYINRYAEAAENKAEAETNAAKKAELLRVAANLRQVAHGPARDLWEAIQLWYIATNIILIESNGHSVSYGRMDQYLYPYYQKDMEQGIYSKEFVQELLDCTFIKAGIASKLRDKVTSVANTGRGWGGESLTIGGVDENGQDATNDLTFMMLDASAHTRMMVPWLCVRMHANTPYELKVKVAECIRAGYGHPKLYNDEAAIPAMQAKGRTLKEARNYVVVGCVELDSPGHEFGWHDAVYMNIAKVFELAVNDGRCFHCGEHCPRYTICGALGEKLGPSTGSLKTFASIDEVMDSYDQQLAYWTNQMVAGIEIMEQCHKKMKPTPYISFLMEDCIETGKDLSEGGARFNHTGPQANGIGTVADSLSAISQLVFDEKRYKGEELLDAVRNNWEGAEVLYALVNSSKVHHYGNDDDYADRFAAFAFNSFCKHIENRVNARGGTYCPGVYTVSANVALGLISGASLDGRKISEPLSDNMGPVHTAASAHDINGPTAVANSVTKMDHSRATNGTLLNWKFSPECVSGEVGRDNLIHLIDTYFGRKGMHSQFIIMSTDTMKEALVHPEKYKDMLVRVAGYSAYFVELSKPLQLDLIARTELSFE